MASDDSEAYLKNIARDIQKVASMLSQVITYMNDAESEVPEKMRRFIMYFHDVHDLRDMYHQIGLEPPDHIMKEIERCSDRFRHLLEDLHSDQGAFERVRQEMSKRSGNRYDYTRQIAVKGHNETGT